MRLLLGTDAVPMAQQAAHELADGGRDLVHIELVTDLVVANTHGNPSAGGCYSWLLVPGSFGGAAV